MCASIYVCEGGGSWDWGLEPQVGKQACVAAPHGFSALMTSILPLPTFSLDAACSPCGRQPQHGSHLTRSLGGVSPPSPQAVGKQDLSALHPELTFQDGRTGSPRQTVRDCPSWASGAKPLKLEACDAAGGPLPVCLKDTGLGSRTFPVSPLDPDHHVAAEPGRSFVLSVETFSDKAFVLFPNVDEAWSPVMISSFKKATSKFPHAICYSLWRQWETPSMWLVPPGSTALSYFGGWPSSVCMVDSDLPKSCLHWLCLDEIVCFTMRAFTPDWVLCACRTGGLG